MPIDLLRKCFRERRRVTVVVLLVFAALKLAGLGAGTLPLPAGVAALGAGCAALLVAVLVPPLRKTTEAMAVASLGVAALAWALPGSAIALTGGAVDVPVAVAVWVGLVALALVAGRKVEALPLPRLRHPRFQARAGTKAELFRLWYGLVPTPGMMAHYGDPEVIAIDDAGARLGRVRLATQAPEGMRETLLQVLEVEAPFHVRLRTAQANAQGTWVGTGVSEVSLVELGPKRLVLFAHTFPNMSLGRACLAWLDDSPGRLLDRRLETIERRARAGVPPLPDAAASTPTPAGEAATANTAVHARARHPLHAPFGAPSGPA